MATDQGLEGVEPEVILLQILAAIGQGAATIRVGYEAAKSVRDTYLQRVTDGDPATWPAKRFITLEWARALGRTAAAAAIARGAFEIEVDDVDRALASLQSARGPEGRCPYTPDPH